MPRPGPSPERLRTVREWRAQGQPVAQIAHRLGTTRMTVWRWLRRPEDADSTSPRRTQDAADPATRTPTTPGPGSGRGDALSAWEIDPELGYPPALGGPFPLRPDREQDHPGRFGRRVKGWL
jgi:hypothetical protein